MYLLQEHTLFALAFFPGKKLQFFKGKRQKSCLSLLLSFFSSETFSPKKRTNRDDEEKINFFIPKIESFFPRRTDRQTNESRSNAIFTRAEDVDVISKPELATYIHTFTLSVCMRTPFHTLQQMRKFPSLSYSFDNEQSKTLKSASKLMLLVDSNTTESNLPKCFIS